MSIGLNFAAALRSFLRQDPNIVLVGEIRDFETAEIAVKAALTGHMVLSTLHTNDAPSAVSRLLNMGIEPFLIAGSVNLICAQRLVRRVCPACAAPLAVSPASLVEIGFSAAEARTVTPRKGGGCDACNGTGYRGRTGLYEVLEMTDPLRERILAGATGGGLRSAAVEAGMVTLRRSGLRKIVIIPTNSAGERRRTLAAKGENGPGEGRSDTANTGTIGQHARNSWPRRSRSIRGAKETPTERSRQYSGPGQTN